MVKSALKVMFLSYFPYEIYVDSYEGANFKRGEVSEEEYIDEEGRTQYREYTKVTDTEGVLRDIEKIEQRLSTMLDRTFKYDAFLVTAAINEICDEKDCHGMF